MNFKDTLLMPKTDFPMRGGLPNKEPQIQEKWDAEDQYKKALEKIKVINLISCMMVHHMQMVVYIWDMHLIKLLRILSSVINNARILCTICSRLGYAWFTN